MCSQYKSKTSRLMLPLLLDIIALDVCYKSNSSRVSCSGSRNTTAALGVNLNKNI